MLLHNIFAGLRSLCSVRNAHSPHCVTAVACPPRMSPYKRDLPQGSPLHPVFLCLRPDEKCCCAPFLPDSVPCAPCAMRTHRTASQQSLVRRTCRRTSGICRRGLPCTPFLCLRPDEKCCSTTFLPDSVPCAPCAMRTHRTASQQSLVRRACRRTSGICRRGLPCTPFFCVSGQTKNVAAHHFCRTPFLVLRAQCALTALLFCLKAYLSSRSGRRSLVISNAFFARQASTSWWLPETSTSGTDSPLYTCGRV